MTKPKLDTQAPPLRNDCFAMPQGVDWTPVDTALAFLRDNLHSVVGVQTVQTKNAIGRVLAKNAIATVSNPPFPNAAIDGYGFAFDSLPNDEVIRLPLCDGRAAAGTTYDDAVPSGCAIRVLTGARLPVGVDSLVLQEDVNVADGHVIFHAGLKKGANTRKAGEDRKAGDVLLAAGGRLRAPDLALLTACGVSEVSVYSKLRVGVLSTGDELKDSGETLTGSNIYDSNRPMLLSLLEQWGFDAVDLGKAMDNTDDVRAMLDNAASSVDAILTSGGASSGDEDHVARLLAAEADLQTWRIAIKPGRPLALALWKTVPVFGLPGNPVAALVCSLKFARPALCLLSGQGWIEPQGFKVPAAFEKRKKAGRREILRARIVDGQVETFKSEGSGRISGLSWADGLVELPDQEMNVERGDLVTYYPYSSFGLV